ncbi:MAG: LytTR family DNA-binding domain-containing protein [Pseudomonadota bacterium]
MADAVNDRVLGAVAREAVMIASRLRFWAVFAGIVTLLGVSGPFGTYDTLPLAVRLLYWAVTCIATFWIGFVTSVSVAGLAESFGARPMPATLLGGLTASLPVAFAVGLVNAVTFGAPVLAGLLDILPAAAVISTLVATMYEMLDLDAREPVSASVGPNPTAWLDRLPARIGRDLILLQAQDHYVLAQTTQGRCLLRTSLSDATSELGGCGLRVHRSWWVAQDWIAGLEYRSGSQVVVLRDGRQVPVGRAYRRAVRAALRRG